MKHALIGIALFSCFLYCNAQDLPSLESHRVHLPNGWSLTPAGSSLPLGDLPLNIAVSRSGRYATVTNNGQSAQSIQLIDGRTNRQLDSVDISIAWGGLIFSEDEKYLYASGGNDNIIIKYAIRDNKLIHADTIVLGARMPNHISPTGIAIDDKLNLLYVVTKEDNSLYVVDLRTKKIVRQLSIGGEGYACLLAPDKKELYITIWGEHRLLVYNTGAGRFTDSITVGDHPNDLCISRDGHTLYVANSIDNSVSVIVSRAPGYPEDLSLPAGILPANDHTEGTSTPATASSPAWPKDWIFPKKTGCPMPS